MSQIKIIDILRITPIYFLLGVSMISGRLEAADFSEISTHSLADKPMHLTFEDRFQGSALNSNIWSSGLANPGNANTYEQQAYVPQEISVSNGSGLTLSVHKRAFSGKIATAGAINSEAGFSQTYGHFEIKVKLPGGSGTWPAFWLLPAAGEWPPEIDVFEYLGRLPTKPHHGMVWVSGGQKRYVGDYAKTSTDFSQDYHVFAIDWRPEAIIYSIDGQETYRITEGVPSEPMYMILNFALGGSWAHDVDASTPFPNAMNVQYVRVYQFNDLPLEQPRFLTFEKPHFIKHRADPGDVVHVIGAIKAGEAGVDHVSLRLSLNRFDGKEIGLNSTIQLGNIEMGARHQFDVTFVLPKSLSPDVYELGIIASRAPRNADVRERQISYFQADQLTVGAPADLVSAP
jgi:beta-glucanase (GH16 family)